MKADLETYAAYREWLTAQGLAHKTIAIYVTSLRRADVWAREQGLDLATVTAVQIVNVATIVPQASRRHMRTALRRYWDMIERKNAPVNAIRVPPKPRARCRALSEYDTRAMVKTAVGWYPEGLAVLFGLFLGLRSSEIGAVEWGRFDEDLAWYTVTGKRDVTATLPVHRVLRSELEGLPRVSGWVFPGGQGRDFVTGAAVWKWVNRVAAAAGLDEKVWPHRLRHTAIATINDNTGDLRAAQEFARHASPETTAIYTRVDAERLRNAVDTLEYV